MGDAQQRITAAEAALRALEPDEGTWPTGDQVDAIIGAALAVPSEAVRFADMVVASLDDPDDGPGDGTYTYETKRVLAEGYMVSGNGPTAYVWFVFTDPTQTGEPPEIDHAYLEYSNGSGIETVAFAQYPAERLLKALRADGAARDRHGR